GSSQLISGLVFYNQSPPPNTPTNARKNHPPFVALRACNGRFRRWVTTEDFNVLYHIHSLPVGISNLCECRFAGSSAPPQPLPHAKHHWHLLSTRRARPLRCEITTGSTPSCGVLPGLFLRTART